MLVPESREWGWERRKNDVRYVIRIRIELGREEGIRSTNGGVRETGRAMKIERKRQRG